MTILFVRSSVCLSVTLMHYFVELFLLYSSLAKCSVEATFMVVVNKVGHKKIAIFYDTRQRQH